MFGFCEGDIIMDLKERFIANAITVMSVKLNNENLADLRNVLTSLFDEYDLVPHKDLPTDEIVDNTNILKHFLAVKKIAGLSPNTLKLYLYHINKFLNYIQRNIYEINTNHVRKYLAQLGMNNRSNSYVDDARRILNSFFTFCENEEYVQKNPCKKIDRIKQHKEMELPYSDTEVELLREACVTPREKALVNFLFSTGCRRDEVRKIKLSEINLTDRSVLIHGKGDKSRMVYFSAKCELSIREYLDTRRISENSDYLFCSDRKPYGQLTNGGLARIVKQIGERANVNNVHLHRFRKWFGTYMVNRGVPIQDLKEMMGHSKLDTTNNYYVYANMDRIKTNHKNNAA